MQYRAMGRSGLKLSAISLGGWTTYGASVKAEDTVRAIIRHAFEQGVNFFDISDIYEKGEAEKAMGKVFAELPRHELVISTKCYWPMSDDVNDKGLSRKHIFESIDKSLRRIGTDYVDIYFCHRPDPETPIEETVQAMSDLVRMGKVLYWGTSEHTGDTMRAAHQSAREWLTHPPRVEQPQLNLLARKRFHADVQPTTAELGMGMVTWSPLASGLLSGKYDEGLPEGSRLWRSENLRNAYLTEDARERVKRFKKVADELGVTRAQLAIAWCMAQAGVSSVITGATRLEQLKANLEALKIKITDEVSKKLDEIFPRDLGK
ncbi:MAG: aldo/keto reductase family protein [Planctomycetes bacterium]|nr:aldo/keto reductase family protein [Planctomycetota bacterium]MCW8135822.1 aldo/keto reductase family protein [Planctomycetota bacterium]